jgi:hypothetical protein
MVDVGASIALANERVLDAITLSDMPTAVMTLENLPDEWI